MYFIIYDLALERLILQKGIMIIFLFQVDTSSNGVFTQFSKIINDIIVVEGFLPFKFLIRTQMYLTPYLLICNIFTT